MVISKVRSLIQSKRELMAKAKLITQITPQVILSKRTNSILIKGLEIRDPELYEIISDQKERARPEFVKRALKVGAIALRDIVVTEKIDYIKKEFQRFCVELDEIFQSKLGKEGMKGVLRTLSPDNVYRTLYYLDEPNDFIRSPRHMIVLMGNHLEGLLEHLTDIHGSPLGGLINALSKTRSISLTSPLLEFNKIYVCAKHPSADPFLETRLDRRTFSACEAIFCLIVMRHLSIKLFDLLRENGKALVEEWKQLDPEWLSWNRDEPISPARGVIPLREHI